MNSERHIEESPPNFIDGAPNVIGIMQAMKEKRKFHSFKSEKDVDHELKKNGSTAMMLMFDAVSSRKFSEDISSASDDESTVQN